MFKLKEESKQQKDQNLSAKLEVKRGPKSDCLTIKLQKDEESTKALLAVVDLANQKKYGRSIQVEDVIRELVKNVSDDQIDNIKRSSMSLNEYFALDFERQNNRLPKNETELMLFVLDKDSQTSRQDLKVKKIKKIEREQGSTAEIVISQ